MRDFKNYVLFLICSSDNLYLTQFLPGKLTFCSGFLKSVALAVARIAAEKMRITIFLILGSEKINELVTSKKLTKILRALLQLVSGLMWPACCQLVTLL
jgi:hypothetical protein